MRKLATGCLAYAVAVTLAQYILPTQWQLWIAGGLTLLAFTALFLQDDWRLRVLLCCLCAALGLFWSWGHWKLYIEPGEALAGQERTVTAQVMTFPMIYEDYSSVQVKLDDAQLPSLKLTMYAYDEDISLLEPGDMIRCEIRFSSATRQYNEETGRYTSKGIYVLGNLQEAPTVTGRAPWAFLHFPKYMAKAVMNAVVRLFPEDVRAFMLALLTGEKQLLYEDMSLSSAMGAAGLYHVVAISGMHVSFLIGMVRTFTGRRRRTAAICIPLILIFIPMSGGGPSVVRAGIMQIFLLLAPILRRENDNLTILSFALAVLLLANPSAVRNAGLQLSFSSMAGVYLLTPMIFDVIREKLHSLLGDRLSELQHFLRASLSSTIGALAFSVPIAALHFGNCSLISPVSNLLTLGVISLCFSAGYLVCILGMLLPTVGAALAWVLAWPVRYVLLLIKLLGGLPFASVYTSNPLIVVWLAVTYLFFGLCWFFRGKRGFRLPVPLGLSVSALVLLLFASSWLNNSLTGRIEILDVGQGQSIAIFSGQTTVVVDCGGQGRGYAGDTAASYLLGQNRFTVDALILTHLHQDHADGAEELLYRLQVKRLFLPPDDPDEDKLLADILKAARERGTEVIYVEEYMTATAGLLKLNLYPPVGYTSANEKGIILTACVGDYDLLITGDVNEMTEEIFLDHIAIPEMDLLMVGHHGSRYSTGEVLLEAAKPKLAVISVGYNNYGHPTQETLERLEQAGAQVLRTDLNGNITIRVK